MSTDARKLAAILVFFVWLAFFSSEAESRERIRIRFLGASITGKCTHVVVATEGSKIDGELTVLESWKGDLQPGDTLTIPELAEFAPPETRKISLNPPFPLGKFQSAKNSDTPWSPDGPPTFDYQFVTGREMVLFLVRDDDSIDASPRWLPGNHAFKASVAWVEAGYTYHFSQRIRTVPPTMRYGSSKEGLHAAVLKEQRLHEARESLYVAAKLAAVSAHENPSLAVSLLTPFLYALDYRARLIARQELPSYGREAFDAVIAAYENQSLDCYLRLDCLRITASFPDFAGPYLVSLLERETAFWKETAPDLPVGWWNDSTLERRSDFQLRYTKLNQTLLTLKEMRPYPPSRRAVEDLRDFWRSLPQLEDKSGLSEISKTCDKILSRLDAS